MTEPNSQPQKDFFLAQSRFVGYGGARGGGKTWAARRKAELLAFMYGGIRILILRRTFPQLRQKYIMDMGAELHGFATYRESHKIFLFPNGSTVTLGYCDREADVNQYQGQEYDIIIIDEATEFTEYQFIKLTAVLRGVNDFPKRMYLTFNPGGVGHAWVKRLFISRQYTETETPDDYTFIPAKVYDNVSLMAADPDYVKSLENLPEDLRRAWLDGDWDVFIGQFFTGWRREVHVVKPHPLTGSWRHYITLDYGMDMLAAYRVSVNEQEEALVTGEVFEGRENGRGQGGGGLLIKEAAARVKALAAGYAIEAWFAPPDLWNRRQDTGRSAAEVFATEGVPLMRVDNSRVQGWLELKAWLQPVAGPEGTMTAKLRVFSCCPNLIESLPSLVYSEKNPSDCASEPHKYTHGPDALRYFVSGRPMAAPAGGGVAPEEELADYDSQLAGFLEYGG